jgi:DNA-binding SARP family transcriptional activator
MAEQLEIRTLGGVTVTRNGTPVDGFVTRKVSGLLIYLACTGQSYPREVLAESLWEERSQAQSLANLRTALNNLRQQVGPFVSITREKVGINPGANIWLDVVALEQN